jgi:hypothetical protein
MYFYEDSGNRVGNFQLSGFAEPQPEPFQQSVQAIQKALDRNPVGGYVKGSAARAELDAAFASVPPCDAIKLYRELRFGTTPLARLFKYRLHPKTFREMLGVLKAKVPECLDLLRQKGTERAPRPGPCLVPPKDKQALTLAEAICHNTELLCKVAGELDEPDGWAKCDEAIVTCRDAMLRARPC